MQRRKRQLQQLPETRWNGCDFASYAFFATVSIKPVLTAPGDPATALIGTFAVFGIGLVARPLGAILFGRLGDLKGRKLALLIAMPMMGISTLIIGLLPTSATIGIAAPILLVASRLAQGFSAGGEVGNAIAFLIEWSPQNRRALYSSLQQASSTAGTLIGALLAAFLSSYLDPASLHGSGWRIPFLIGGLVIAPFGLYMRSKVQESPYFADAQKDNLSKVHSSSTNSAWLMGAKVVGFSAVWVVNFYVFLIYVPIYLSVHGHLDQSASLWINSVGLLVEVIFILIGAMVSDVIGRKPLLIGASLCVLVFSYPLFLLFLYSSSHLPLSSWASPSAVFWPGYSGYRSC